MKKPLIIGHRGACGYAPENTMASFKKALNLNCDGIELDVHLSKDGHLVVCHDERVDRTTDGIGYIKDLSLKEIKNLDAGMWYSKEYKGERIPTLEEVLDICYKSNILVNIEIKSGIVLYNDIEKKVINLIEKYDMKNNVILSSFNHYSLLKVKDISKDIKTGLLYMCGLIDPWVYGNRVGADAIHPSFYSLTSHIVRGALKNNLKINTYTVNDEKIMDKIVKLGVSGIITNYPDRLLWVINNTYNKY